MQIFGVLAAILHLGNIKMVKDGDRVSIENPEGNLYYIIFIIISFILIIISSVCKSKLKNINLLIVLKFVGQILGIDANALQRALLFRRMSAKVILPLISFSLLQLFPPCFALS